MGCIILWDSYIVIKNEKVERKDSGRSESRIIVAFSKALKYVRNSGSNYGEVVCLLIGQTHFSVY